MGLLKRYATLLHGRGGGSREALRKQAQEAEEEIKRRLRMTLATEAEWRAWLLNNEWRKWKDCVKCPDLCEAKSVVFGYGVMEPLMLVIDDTPSRQDDRTGMPLSGVDGSLLKKVSERVGINFKRDTFCTSLVACRTPVAGEPGDDEVDNCRPRLAKIVSTTQPYVILLLGDTVVFEFMRLDDMDEASSMRGLISKDRWPDLDLDAKRNLKAIFAVDHPRDVRAGAREDRRLIKRFGKTLGSISKVLGLLNEKVERSYLRANESWFDE